MRGARFRDEKLCSCALWRFNCGGAIITANTVVNNTVHILIFMLFSSVPILLYLRENFYAYVNMIGRNDLLIN